PRGRGAAAYGERVGDERRRHGDELNPAYRQIHPEHGLVFSGLSPDVRLVEIIELPDHPFYMGGQFHPELRSRPTRPHPLLREFVGAAHARRTASAERPVSFSACRTLPAAATAEGVRC